jgi:hypothetical protein
LGTIIPIAMKKWLNVLSEFVIIETLKISFERNPAAIPTTVKSLLSKNIAAAFRSDTNGKDSFRLEINNVCEMIE